MHNHRNISKVSVMWVPPLQEQYRVECCKVFLTLCGTDSIVIITRIVTGIDTWVHFYDSESKNQPTLNLRFVAHDFCTHKLFSTERRLQNWNNFGLQVKIRVGAMAYKCGSPTPKELLAVSSAGKVMATIFWNFERILLSITKVKAPL